MVTKPYEQEEEEKASGGSFFDDRRSFVILRVTAAAGISKSYKTSRAQHVKHASKDADGSNPSVPTITPPSGGFFGGIVKIWGRVKIFPRDIINLHGFVIKKLTGCRL